MRILKRGRVRGFVWGVLFGLLLSSTGNSQDKSVIEGGVYYGCGKPKSIPGYQLKWRGAQISLPSYVTIKRNESVLFSDANPSKWEPPYTSARYAALGNALLILTLSDDCVDVQLKRLFIIQEDGRVIHQPVWTSTWKDGFFLEDGVLTYWSEWFCRSEDKEKEAGKSYVYAFSKNKQLFERVETDETKYCGRPLTRRFIRFRPFRSIASK